MLKRAMVWVGLVAAPFWAQADDYRVPGFACEAECLSVDYADGIVVNFGWTYETSVESEFAAMERLQRKCRKMLAEAGYHGATLAKKVEVRRRERIEEGSGSSGSESSGGSSGSSRSGSDWRRYSWTSVEYATAFRDEDSYSHDSSSSYSSWRTETREWEADIKADFVDTQNGCRAALVDPTVYYEGPTGPLG